MKTTRIHVNQHIIKSNRKTGRRDPVLTIKDYKNNRRALRARVTGTVDIIYDPDHPLDCGAVCWIETKDKVKVVKTAIGKRLQCGRGRTCPSR